MRWVGVGAGSAAVGAACGGRGLGCWPGGLVHTLLPAGAWLLHRAQQCSVHVVAVGWGSPLLAHTRRISRGPCLQAELQSIGSGSIALVPNMSCTAHATTAPSSSHSATRSRQPCPWGSVAGQVSAPSTALPLQLRLAHPSWLPACLSKATGAQNCVLLAAGCYMQLRSSRLAAAAMLAPPAAAYKLQTCPLTCCGTWCKMPRSSHRQGRRACGVTSLWPPPTAT